MFNNVGNKIRNQTRILTVPDMIDFHLDFKTRQFSLTYIKNDKLLFKIYQTSAQRNSKSEMEFGFSDILKSGSTWGSAIGRKSDGEVPFKYFKRLNEYFLFYGDDVTDEGATNPGKIVLLRDGEGVASLNADLLGAERIASHVWLSYEDTDRAENQTYKGSLLLALSREWTDPNGAKKYSIDMYKVHPFATASGRRLQSSEQLVLYKRDALTFDNSFSLDYVTMNNGILLYKAGLVDNNNNV
jgi:hypothetical protein